MLNKVKNSMHYALNISDDEINDIIFVCRREAENSGVVWDETDPSIAHLCCCYVKWRMNYMSMGDTWEHLYRDILRSLVLTPTTTYNQCSL